MKTNLSYKKAFKPVAIGAGKMVRIGTNSNQNKVEYIQPKSKNLFNCNDLIFGYYITTSGSFVANSGFSCSNYIPVLPNTTYTFSGTDASNNDKVYAFYDSDKIVTANEIKGGHINTNPTFTTPSDCYYLVFIAVWNNETQPTIYSQLEEGSVASSYFSYNDEYSVYTRQTIPSDFTKVLASGSSRTYGTGASNIIYAWVNLLHDSLTAKYVRSVTVINRGLAAQKSYQNLQDLQIKIAAEQPQILICEINVNDAAIIDGISIDNSLINIEAIINMALDNGIVVMLLGCPKTTLPAEAWDNAKVDELNDMGKALSSKYHLSFIDADLYFDSHTGLLEDGVHFSDSGHSEINSMILGLNLPTPIVPSVTPDFDTIDFDDTDFDT